MDKLQEQLERLYFQRFFISIIKLNCSVIASPYAELIQKWTLLKSMNNLLSASNYIRKSKSKSKLSIFFSIKIHWNKCWFVSVWCQSSTMYLIMHFLYTSHSQFWFILCSLFLWRQWNYLQRNLSRNCAIWLQWSSKRLSYAFLAMKFCIRYVW